MNLIPKIAEMLGVELNEVFKIKVNGEILESNYRIIEHGIELTVFSDNDWRQGGRMLEALLDGEAEIVKLHFEPKPGEFYYSVYWDKILRETPEAVCSVWESCADDWHRLKLCNVFRTKAEAEAHKFEIYEKLTGRKWEEK